ncbi:S-protein homolog 24-like [Papaver somniferum]|uniref:S-protein homolog 24-like n=1 Tax=Papaver somniferum TaxID=3469 RepID=UPI000E6FF74F|nr:S-protein homolog 24-like [Papaver somniferum]
MMMSGSSGKLTGALLSVVVIFAVIVPEGSSRVLPNTMLDDSLVTVKNDIAEKISCELHCYSSETDFGDHTLAYGQEFSWKFKINALRTTKYWCDMWFVTEEGVDFKGGYTIYKANRDYYRCANDCHYYIRMDGVYQHVLEDYTEGHDELIYPWP